MFRMGQDQSKGMELEDQVVESQSYGVARTLKVRQSEWSSPNTCRASSSTKIHNTDQPSLQ